MSGDLVIQLGQEALMIVLLVSAPMLGLGLIVGLAVSVFQATTSIQEQTLAFIPKIIAVFVAILIFGPWMLRIMVEYCRNVFINLPAYLG
ncbi:MAG: flagellar biosynthesis protein FliQ [Veillonellaceae bacterium]|jgi:flagellar biosynthetic protein FliQ|uniref:flagellar biosynthesis protein FliQ n=1 Tax=Selenomonas sp. TaxID=2053611 RepID=UPI0025E98339|nr:flagellar biosynthesis protein FliQ [Selenomonas sp.]MCI7541362.1 flagellar biosynthesis protein FliQ [Veillonellaceae bacterium]MCI6100802.1 flagellar biosynthesis protein FliQ [Selenomonas sp.]MCI6231757.1 flagellar biosynthesis protein FliQ [Selenomonas sp.]MDD6126855.1 flagellar biosynthesis protein FliQ [Veillonellaceae bacterium]MDD6698111.1 flagellar biosynthesis protein FliQ [Veillonellaceae bacterium]